jgi:hypothetical protein
MSLVQAIDELLSSVPDDGQFPWEGDWRDRFEALDRAVWVEACRRGWEGKLPGRSGSPDKKYLGKTALPVLGTSVVLIPVGLRAWRSALLALRRLAEEAASSPTEPAAVSGGGSSVQAKKDTAHPSLDARALAVFLEHTDWTKKRIAEYLGCNAKSLCPDRCPRLTNAMAAYKSPIDPDRRHIRGWKDKDGTLEAYEDD